MDGFTYSRLGGLSDQDNNQGGIQITDRPAKWFISWLYRDETYSPQPYHQLAGVLTAMGHSEKANAILHASKNRERKIAFASKHRGKWLGLSFLQATIGYGYGARYFRSLLWVLGLIISGVIVLYSLPAGQVPFICSFGNRLGFSLDMLLPIVELDERYKLTFDGWQLYYFYFHKLMGFLLGSFVVAGLSGITKK